MRRPKGVGRYAFVSTADLLESEPIVILTPDDETRLAALERTQDRQNYVAVRILVRLLLSRYAGVEYLSVRIRQRCAACHGFHGKPEVIFPTGYHVSWTHHQGFVAAVVGNSSVGIDLVARTRGSSLSQSEAISEVTPRNLSEAEALFKAGVGASLDQLLTSNSFLSSTPYVDRENRRVRLRRHSTEDVEVCIASIQEVLPVSIHSLLADLSI